MKSNLPVARIFAISYRIHFGPFVALEVQRVKSQRCKIDVDLHHKKNSVLLEDPKIEKPKILSMHSAF